MFRLSISLYVFFLPVVTAVEPKKNVLFIAVDDLRPELSAFKSTIVQTPYIDDLATKSLVLKSAYVQQSVCGPSRTSLLTGRRPDTTLVYNLKTYWRYAGGNFTTLPQYFKENGYRTAGLGKIFHPGHGDDQLSWTDTYYHAPNKRRWTIGESWAAIPKSMYEGQPLPDTQLADEAISKLRDMSTAALDGTQPFFLSIGFHKPHLPFVFPEEFLDQYPKEDISLPSNPYAPIDMPDAAWSSYGELRAYSDIANIGITGDINDTMPDTNTLDLRRAYYASISYIDEEIGRVLSELDKLELANNTIIGLWGDHGFSLGEHAEWCKNTNFEDAVHAPLMLSVPGKTDSGIVTDQLVEFVDIFPSLVDAADLPQVALCPDDSSLVLLCTEGKSFLPLIEDANQEWKTAAFSQMPKTINGHNAMGYTIRTADFRYTEWVRFNAKTNTMNWNQLYDVELYDHRIDPEENINIAGNVAYGTDLDNLRDILHKGWRYALP